MTSVISHQSTPQTSSFTCNTCSIRFVTAELQRQHMKTEWHRYNLKRRVAQLPSISSDVFADKVLNQEQLSSDLRQNEDEDGFYVHYRKVKNNTNKSLTKQLAEKKRLAQETTRGRPVEVTDLSDSDVSRAASPVSIVSDFSQFSLGDNSTVHDTESGSEINYSDSDFVDVEAELEDESDSDEALSETESIEEAQAIPITHCFYCGIDNHEVEPNLKHMFKHHGLYIPERTYVSDLRGLLSYLSEAISLDHDCLVCGFQGKNLLSIRQHIYSKGHCKLPYESKEEKLAVAEFYDFTDSVSDTTRTKSKSNKKVSFNEGAEVVEEDNEEEETSSDDDLDHGINDNYTLVKVDRSGVELTLPTGSRIGHRSMTRYYRQNIALSTEPKDSTKTVALVDRRFAPGLTSHEVTKQEKQTRRLQQKLKNYDVNRSKSYRANFQKHFVDEMLGHA